MQFKICLIGSIPKGDSERKGWVDWKTKFKQALSKLENIEFVDGDDWKDETEPLLLLGHDANMVKISDLIIVDAEKPIGNGIGAGTAQEILIAKYFNKPVITVLPKDTHHRRSNITFHGVVINDWIHPFLLATSDLVVETIEEAIPWIKEFISDPRSKKIKNISIIDNAIESFLEFQKGQRE
ncbi:MAG: hypothetical protein A3B31_00800 [Candidatus Komeilibacteria bacterium RIFCSPLOWO2_01_FULL_53_11]|uniref:Nucleoside 2-deoxyribosyltransferase n=1 Tax=Candidatus Komeilibacteria bacterium RIFCSPLOWO2_01_FULL_53_11 TaxID=1798552 RepID=A0A1G2BSA4_9BACT|nr:MAG: hypothetical protein A3B31_00800 [Candidatus Komeilibacteria bacterium RIFCSPLOWO2_01_FULL_53_11]